MAGHQFPEPTPSWYIFSTGTSCSSSLSRSLWVGAFRENPLQVLGLWFIDPTSSKRVGRGQVWTFSALGHTATLQLVERLLGAIALLGHLGMKLFAKVLLLRVYQWRYFFIILRALRFHSCSQKWNWLFLKCKGLLLLNCFLVST